MLRWHFVYPSFQYNLKDSRLPDFQHFHSGPPLTVTPSSVCFTGVFKRSQILKLGQVFPPPSFKVYKVRYEKVHAFACVSLPNGRCEALHDHLDVVQRLTGPYQEGGGAAG